MPDLAGVIRSEAEDAKKDPAELASFKALRLNMGTSDVVESVLLDPETWKGIEVEETELKRTGRFVLGLDLGSGVAMSCASAYWPESGALDCYASAAVYPKYG